MHVLRRKECGFLRTRSYSMGKKRKKLKGRVDKVIKPVFPTEPEKAQISVGEGDELYREIRIEQ